MCHTVRFFLHVTSLLKCLLKDEIVKFTTFLESLMHCNLNKKVTLIGYDIPSSKNRFIYMLLDVFGVCC